MHEIEVKAKIRDEEALKEKLASLGCKFGVTLTQNDIVFLPEGIKFQDIKPGISVLRIRKSNNEILFTLKKRTENANNELIMFEKELIVDNEEKAIEIIKNLGYYEVLRIKKQRVESKYNGMTICLDEVGGLGKFIEIEKMSEINENDDDVLKGLEQFLFSLGVEKEDQVKEGYDTLIMNMK